MIDLCNAQLIASRVPGQTVVASSCLRDEYKQGGVLILMVAA